jgi:hypothetical protein
MNSRARILILSELCKMSSRLQQINKEISSVDVPSAFLVREDLGIRLPKGKKHKDVAYGQRHKQPVNNNRITPPAGMGIHSDSGVAAPFYQQQHNGT